MAQISITNLTFCYDGSFDNIFENVSFSVDSNWKLGLIGRNGKGKTTLARLLLGRYEYEGKINASGLKFDYFPYEVTKIQMKKSACEFLQEWKACFEEWRVICEMDKLNIDSELLYRPFETLSFGERTKVMLAVLFSGTQEFLIIDEPTNHLDYETRETVKQYLKNKKGFILISHDRDLLDGCIDHVLVLNRKTIEVQNGNFSSWWENKKRQDSFDRKENEKHLKEIQNLKTSIDQSSRWADKNEATKIGFNPVKEHDRCISTRAYIGAKTKKMQARVKSYENRLNREIQEKEGLLKDIETTIDLKVTPKKFHKDVLIRASDLTLRYFDSKKPLFEHLEMEIKQGERVFLHGHNGCGKSTLIKQVLSINENGKMENEIISSGELWVGKGLSISYISQDTSFLQGRIEEFSEKNNLDRSLLFSILRQLDFERNQLKKPMESFSEGQKKKLLIASSLLTSGHLYIWDEPLNYIDVFSRMQIEKLIQEYKPTMLIVDHDIRFREKIATKIIDLDYAN